MPLVFGAASVEPSFLLMIKLCGLKRPVDYLFIVPPWLDEPPLLVLAFLFFLMESDCVVVLRPSLW